MTALAGISECLICGQKFAGPTGVIVGDDPRSSSIAQYMLKLAQHLIEKHPADNNRIDLSAAAYQGMLRLLVFKTTDRTLQDQRDRFRWSVHQATLVGHISDETIHSKSHDVAKVLFDAISRVGDSEAVCVEKFADILAPVFTFLRDQLEETGKYEGAVERVPVSTLAPV